jgi:hypothetical protein
MNSDLDEADAMLAAAALQRFVFLGCRDKPGKDEDGWVRL